MADGKKYHINPDTGRPNICTATGKRGCKYKAEDGTEPPHFPTKEDAQAYQNNKDEQEYGSVATVKKSGGELKREFLDRDEMKQVVGAILEDERNPEIIQAQEKLRESITDFYYQSKDFNNLPETHPGRKEDEEELRHISQVVREDLARVQELRAATKQETPAKVTLSPVQEFHARGEKRIRELQEAELDLDEQVVELESDIDGIQDNLRDLEAMRDSLVDDANYTHGDAMEHRIIEVDAEIDELSKRGDDLRDEYEEKVKFLNEARDATAQARAKYLGTMEERAQMAEIEGNMDNLREEVSELNAVVKERKAAIEGGDTSAEARNNLNSALASKAIARATLEEERERRLELQGNIYSRATGKQVNSELTPGERKMRDATTVFHERGNALEDAQFIANKAEKRMRAKEGEMDTAMEAPSKEQVDAYGNALDYASGATLDLYAEQESYRKAVDDLLAAQDEVDRERGES